MKDIFSDVIVLDLETTDSACEKAEVIEIGISTFNDNQWEAYSELFCPITPPSPSATAVNHITMDMLEGHESFDKSANKIKKLLESKKYVISHNYSFEKCVLSPYGIHDLKWICTLRFAKKLFNDDPTVNEYSLYYLAYRFNLIDPRNENHAPHRAGYDAYVNALLFEFLTKEAVRAKKIEKDYTIDDIVEWISEPIYYDVMPFGKWKDYKLTDVPLDYWEWALNNMDKLNEKSPSYDSDFAESVARAVSIILEKENGSNSVDYEDDIPF